MPIFAFSPAQFALEAETSAEPPRGGLRRRLRSGLPTDTVNNMCVVPARVCYYSVSLKIDDFSIDRDSVVNTPRGAKSCELILVGG